MFLNFRLRISSPARICWRPGATTTSSLPASCKIGRSRSDTINLHRFAGPVILRVRVLSFNMRMHIFELILSSFLFASLHAKSIIPLRLQPSIAEAYDKLGSKQQHLALPKAPVFSQATSHYYDAAQNSVGVLFTTADTDVEVVHFWLPLGRKVFTREFYQVPGDIRVIVLTNPRRLSSAATTSAHSADHEPDKFDAFPCSAGRA